MSVELLKKVWAKSDPYHSVLHHCIDVGCCCWATLEAPAFSKVRRELEECLGLAFDDGLGRWLGYLLACHDLGKCHPHFQWKVPDLAAPLREEGFECFDFDCADGFRHESISAQFLDCKLRGLGWGRKPVSAVRHFIKGHHGNFSPKKGSVRTDRWSELLDCLDSELWNCFNPPDWKPQKWEHHGTASLLLSGLLVFCDWIASNSDFFGLEAGPDEATESYFIRSLTRAEECLKELNLWDGPARNEVSSFEDVWRGFSPRPLQEACVELLADGGGAGILLVEAPMGEGKSELSVYAALKMSEGLENQGGFYVALPTAATSNQMYGRIRDFVSSYRAEYDQSVKLTHGAAWLVDRSSGLPASTPDQPLEKRWVEEWFRPSKRALLSPFGVGTVDQAMMAGLNVKFGFLRWLGLAKGALIIDEVHAYDEYMSVIICRLLEWCGALKVPVVLLSATLPEKTKRSWVRAYLGETPEWPKNSAYPLLSYFSKGGEPLAVTSEATKKNQLEIELWEGLLSDPCRVVARTLERIKQGGVACILCNTVNSAQATYEELLRTAPGDVETLMFHARFAAGDRQKVEERVLELFDKRSLKSDGPIRPAKAILVATQVVEQSLDIDFDFMVSEMAPVDLLLQRSGRVHRHDERIRPDDLKNPCLAVAMRDEDWGGTGKVYSLLSLLRTEAVVRSKPLWRCPEDFRELVESVYGEDTGIDTQLDPEALAEALEEAAMDREKMEEAAAAGLLRSPRANQAEFVQTGENNLAEEGEGCNPLVARTRYGNDSVTVYLLNRTAHLEKVLARETRPDLGQVRELMLGRLSLLRYWCRDEPLEGYLPMSDAPRWLGFGRVLWMDDGLWEGEKTTLTYDLEFGLRREVKS